MIIFKKFLWKTDLALQGNTCAIYYGLSYFEKFGEMDL